MPAVGGMSLDRGRMSLQRKIRAARVVSMPAQCSTSTIFPSDSSELASLTTLAPPSIPLAISIADPVSRSTTTGTRWTFESASTTATRDPFALDENFAAVECRSDSRGHACRQPFSPPNPPFIPFFRRRPSAPPKLGP